MTRDSAAPAKPILVFRSYARSLFWLFLGMVVSFIIFGLLAPYWNKAMANLLAVHEALLYNEGSPQYFLWYPAHISPILLGLWYQILHLVGLLPEYKLSSLPATATADQFDATWQKLVALGYVESFVIGCLFVLASIALIRRLTGSWQVAVLAGVALAFSDGIALAYRTLRGSSEMLSSALVFVALLLTCIAASETGNARRFLYLGLAGLLVGLALTEKVQALLPALTIPMIALTFGKDERSVGATIVSRGEWLRAVALCAIGLAVLFPTIGLLEQGISSMPTSHITPNVPGHGPVYYRPLSGGLSGVYQWLLAIYVAGAMLLYALIYRVRAIDAVTALMAVFIGLALGFLTLHWRYDIISVVAVTNPVEHLSAASGSPGPGTTTSILGLGGKLLHGLENALAVHTFFLRPSHRPTLLIEWLSFYAAFVLWRRGELKAALQIVGLLVAAIAIDASFTLRAGMGGGIKVYYVPYTDPFIVLAGAMALARFYGELLSAKTQKAVLALMLVYVVWGHFEPSRATYGEHKKTKVCGLVAPFIEGLDIPYCQSSNTPAPSDG